MKLWPRRDPLEWRNDRPLRFDLWRILNGDVDRAAVVIATIERQRIEHKGGVSDGDMGAD